ncbi:hypothetical protein PP178_04045 [Zeaxanthinibacter sp. PT1]|uniref:hypothetical protein n=1 Tax=Zeaxanthinibacter TaxID=561554 RepID=UPI00234C02A6|nr:hypothetical protein [Zeaxanthinibacter sp. PT1]MDC6350712.1 hypothetical protein [Zeaxanthinibacter sp. PT1]
MADSIFYGLLILNEDREPLDFKEEEALEKVFEQLMTTRAIKRGEDPQGSFFNWECPVDEFMMQDLLQYVSGLYPKYYLVVTWRLESSEEHGTMIYYNGAQRASYSVMENYPSFDIILDKYSHDKEPKKKYDYFCKTCGDNSILHTAWAVWNPELEEYELHGDPMDHEYCETCDRETKAEFKPI